MWRGLIMYDLLTKTIDYGQKLTDFLEIRCENIVDFEVALENGEIKRISEGNISGCCARALYNGSWGFAVTEILTKESLFSMVKSAVSLAKGSEKSKRQKIELAETKIIEDNVILPVKKDPTKVNTEEKVSIIKRMDETVFDHSDRITSCSVNLDSHTVEKTYINSEGTNFTEKITRTEASIFAVAKDGNLISPASESIAGTVGFEIFDEFEPEQLARIVAERATKLLKARLAPAGEFTVIIDPGIVGLLAHEAFGHCAEADFVISGSILKDKIGEQMAAENVSLIDEGLTEGALGSFKYDDEGVPSQSTMVVKNGYLESYLHNRETAKIFGVEPTGNARAQSYAQDPLIRMRNTAILPGDWSFEELIEDTKDGVYLKGSMGGQADSNGEFMFGIQEGYFLENGEIGVPFRGATISGNAIQVMLDIDALGKDFTMGREGGRCGKIQSMWVDLGGPHLRTRMKIGGE